jgi:hypothetical protein
VATLIVDGFHDMITLGVEEAEGPPLELTADTTFKSTITDKIYHVGWMEDERAWLISADSRYGLWCPYDADFLRYTRPSTAKAGVPGNNAKGYQVGDKLIGLRSFKYEIVATGDKCALLQSLDGTLSACPNDDLELFYKRAQYDSGLFD